MLALTRTARMLLACVILAACASSAPAAPDTRMIVFGDSYEDVGNINWDPPYYMGRASNGPVWVEDLATDLQLPVPVRSTAGGANATDFAFSGAAATGSYLNSAPDLSAQVGTYLARGRPTGNELVVIKIGGADLLFGPGNPSLAANVVKAQIARLAGQGVKSFLVANEPRLGSVPAYLGTSDEARVSLLGDQFNADLDVNLATLRNTLGPGVDLRAFDLHALFADAVAHPQAYGLTDVTHSALDTGARDPNHYLWWDVRHPTASFHQVMADRAALIVPEPAAAPLLGLSVLTLLRRRRLRSPRECPRRGGPIGVRSHIRFR